MIRKIHLGVVTALAGHAAALAILTGVFSHTLSVAQARPAERAINIEGNYKLKSREMPNGTSVRPPEVIGMMTLTKDERNFNVYWAEKGKRFSASYVSKYKLTATQFTETNVYSLMNDEIHGKPLAYDLSDTTSSSAVTKTPKGIKFQLPLHGEPGVEFTGKGFDATMPGAFVDHWEKIQ